MDVLYKCFSRRSWKQEPVFCRQFFVYCADATNSRVLYLQFCSIFFGFRFSCIIACFVIILCWNLRTTVVNMFLNIKISFYKLFIMHMINMGLFTVFFNAWRVWYLCSMKMLINAFSVILKRFYFYQTEVPFLNKTWKPFPVFLFIMRRSETRGAYGSAQRNSARYLIFV